MATPKRTSSKKATKKKTSKKKTTKTNRRKKNNVSGDSVLTIPSLRSGPWQNPDGSRRGRQLGTPNRSTLEIMNRLQELDCDPLEYAVKFLKGEDSPNSHPFLQELRKFFFAARKYKMPPTFKSLLSTYEVKANEMLGPGTWLDPKIRAKLASDLLAYMYPKLQSITHKGGHGEVIDPNKKIHELSDEELFNLAMQLAQKEIDAHGDNGNAENE